MISLGWKGLEGKLKRSWKTQLITNNKRQTKLAPYKIIPPITLNI